MSNSEASKPRVDSSPAVVAEVLTAAPPQYERRMLAPLPTMPQFGALPASALTGPLLADLAEDDEANDVEELSEELELMESHHGIQRHEPQRHEGQRHEGQRHEGQRHEGQRHEGQRHEAQRHEAQRHEIQRSEPGFSTSQLIATTGVSRRRCMKCNETYPGDFRVCPRDATPLEDLASEDVDTLLGTVLAETYQLVRVLGEGGMGRVYEARHKRLLGKRFAIKVMHAELKREPLVVGRFLREAAATSALQHPNIVGILDVNEVPDGRPYLVAELLEGEHLGAYFERQGRLTVEDAVAICRPICQALMAAHSKGIIHRDIKPENLFLVGTGRARTTKVLDFGISRVGEAAAKLTKTGTVMGTPTYMPPEQARGRRVDQRADIYSVGAILYEALTGRRPFVGVDSMSTLAAVLSEDPPRPCSLAPTIPPGLELVIQKAMAKSPKERYRTMRDLDDALAEFDTRAMEFRRSEQQARNEGAQQELLYGVLGSSSDAPALARTSLAVHSIAGGVLALAAAVEITLSSAHLARGATPLTGTEVFFASLGSMGVLLAPLAVWAFYLVTRVWNNTPRVLDVLDRTRYVVGACLAAYCAVTIVMHILSLVLHIDPLVLAWPGWGLGSCVLAILGGIAVARATLRSRRNSGGSDDPEVTVAS